MALKKPTTSPAFEQEPTTTTTNEGGAAVAEKPTNEGGAAAAKAEATTAVATAAASSVAVNDALNAAKAFKKEVEEMFNAADFSYGSHRVFKAKDGVIKEMNGDKLVLGKWVKGRLLAWGRHFEISPGEDGASSAAFVAYSQDGVTIDNVIGEDNKSWEGKPVADYLEYLRTTEEFENACKREFIDTEVAVLGSEEEPGFTGVVQITLSSSSIPAFSKYQTDLAATAKCVAMNLPGYKLPEDPFTLYFIREAAEKGKNSWTKIRLSPTLPAKV